MPTFRLESPMIIGLVNVPSSTCATQVTNTAKQLAYQNFNVGGELDMLYVKMGKNCYVFEARLVPEELSL